MYLKICEEHLLLIYLSDVSVRYVWKSIFTGETGERRADYCCYCSKNFLVFCNDVEYNY